MLDLASVRLFVLVAEFGNLTRAAEAAGTVQPVVSQRLKALEAQIGRRLFDRSPRHVRLTPDGLEFLPRAQALMAAHDAALRPAAAAPLRVAVGLSDHATGLGLAVVLRRVRVALPAEAVLEVRVGFSHHVRAAVEAGDCDAAVIRREAGGGQQHRTAGEVLGVDPLGWRAAPGHTLAADAPVPLATLGTPCGVRAAALRALDQARRPWRETFVAGSCAAVLAGAQAGFGVAPMGRLAAGGAEDLGGALGLPALPVSEIVLLGRAASPLHAAVLRALAAGVRASLSS